MNKIKQLTDEELNVANTAVNLLAAILNVKPDLVIRILADGADLNNTPHERVEYMLEHLKTEHYVKPERKARQVFKLGGAFMYEPEVTVFDVASMKLRYKAGEEYIVVVKPKSTN